MNCCFRVCHFASFFFTRLVFISPCQFFLIYAFFILTLFLIFVYSSFLFAFFARKHLNFALESTSDLGVLVRVVPCPCSDRRGHPGKP